MWIFTPEGFVSGVEDRHDPTVIIVRSRDHASLRALCDVLEIRPSKIKSEGNDYPYRIRISRQQFATFAYEMAYGVEYPNFKNAATRVRGTAYHDVLLSIWATTMRLTPRRVKARQRVRAAATRWQPIDSWYHKHDRLQLALDSLPDEGDDPLPPLMRDVHSLTDAEWADRERSQTDLA